MTLSKPVRILIISAFFALTCGSGCSDDSATKGGADSLSGDGVISDGVISDGLGGDTTAATDAAVDTGDAGGDCTSPPAVCTSDADCAGGEKCIGTQCVPPVPAGPFALTGTVGLMANVHFPLAGDNCCIDLNGDGVNDNQLGYLATLSPGLTTKVQQHLDTATAAGKFKYLLEVRSAPKSGCGPAEVWLYRADDDVDDDGLPDAPLADQLAGKGVFQATADSLRPDGYGSAFQFNGATMQNGIITSAPVSFPFDFVLPDGSVMTAMVENAVLQMSLGSGGTALAVTAATPSVSIGGYVRLSSLVDSINVQAKGCACAGVNIAKPMASGVISGGVFNGKCEQQPSTAAFTCQPGAPDICTNLTATCSAVMLLGAFADISTGTPGADGTTAKDAVSFGLYFDLVKAGLAPANVAPSFVAVGDTWKVQKGLVVPANGPATQLNVLANDIYAPAVSPVITAVTQGSLGGAVAIAPSGIALSYTPAALTVGIETFTYTIQDGAGATSTATVTTSIQALSAMKPDCINYCGAAQLSCTGANSQYASYQACYDYCVTTSGMPIGTAGETSGDSIACRSWAADMVNSGQAPAAKDCAVIGPTGGGVCGTRCEVYCRLMAKNCPATYGDAQTCAAACDPLSQAGKPNATSGDTVQCRITFADDAGTCGEAAAVGSAACVASCQDQIMDGNETGVDCGGSCPTACAVGAGCASGADCASGFCDTALPGGVCVECLTASDCPATGAECVAAACTAGLCGTSMVAKNQVVAGQVAGDCQNLVCDGAGAITTADDAADLPAATTCHAAACQGVPAAPAQVAASAGTPCSDPKDASKVVCGDAGAPGACVQCNQASDCPTPANECLTATCVAHACGTAPLKSDHVLSTNVQDGDCQKQVCDGAGGTTTVDDPSDVAKAATPCNKVACAGKPLAPALAGVAPGTTCIDPKDPNKTMCGDGVAFGSCVQCNQASDCPKSTNECTVATCDKHVCSTANLDSTHKLSTGQVDKNCQLLVCDGAGGVKSVDDPTDLPTSVACNTGACSGTPLAPAQAPVTAGSACVDPQNPKATMCSDGAAPSSCVQCNQPSDCPQAPAPCSVATCDKHVCGVKYYDSTYALPSGQLKGDCAVLTCNGKGSVIQVLDPTDNSVPPVQTSGYTDKSCLLGYKCVFAGQQAQPEYGTACNVTGVDYACGGNGVCQMCKVATDCPLPPKDKFPNQCGTVACWLGGCFYYGASCKSDGLACAHPLECSGGACSGGKCATP